jgi:hypothetical protein
MSFILVPKHGDDVRVNGWNWRPTLHLLANESLIGGEFCERMGANGCGAEVDAELACRIADVIERALLGMKLGDRILYDLIVTDLPKKHVTFGADSKASEIDRNDLYSASYEWLVTFRDFCRRSGGFKVV